MQKLVLRMLKKGMRQYEIAAKLSISYDVVHEIARKSGIEYASPQRSRQLTDAEKKEITRLRELEGLPIRAIAIRTGIAKSTVGDVTRRRFLAVADQGGTVARPEMLKVPRRCPRHGLMRLWPCVACQADPI